MSKYLHIWLGSENDPKPVFRDEQPGAFAWPEGAVMAVRFTKAFYTAKGQPLGREVRTTLPRTEFYGEDGWPLDLGHEHRDLSDIMRREFQVFPGDWRDWDEETWDDARQRPGVWHLAHVQAPLVHALLSGRPVMG